MSLQKQKADEAIPFIFYTEKEGFKLNDEAIEYLKTLPKERKLGIVSIVGKYRTGKSFFVNRVLLNKSGKSSGFTVGPTINPCTKGLWLWKKTLKSESDDDMDILLIDTEGFGGMDENVNHDSRIFLFSLLLSSYFIYNSVGSIDENALNSLSLIINLAKDIQIKSGGGQDDDDSIAQYFPSFLWIVRDFALQLKDNKGNPISSREYLEKSLENQKGVSDAVESKNRIRRMMKHFFRERDCSTLVRPTEQEKDLQNLNDIPNNSLRHEFVDQMSFLRTKIFKKIKPKTFGQKTINGEILIEICQAYLKAINTGQLPNIENAWTYVCQAESRKALDKTVEQIQQTLFQIQDAVDNVQLEQMRTQLKEQAIQQLKKGTVAPQEELGEYIEELEKQFQEEFKQFKKKNKQLWQKRYEEVCRDGVMEIENKLNQQIYQNFYEFQADFLKFQDQYNKQTPDGPNKHNYFQEISGRLHKIAAEKVSKNVEQSLIKQNKMYQQKLEIMESDLSQRKNQFDTEKQSLYEKITLLEKQKNELEINSSVQQERNERLREEKHRLEQDILQLKQNNKNFEQKKEQELQQSIRELQDKLNNNQNCSQKQMSEMEMKNALLGQEKMFQDKEINQLKSKNESLELEVRKYMEESKQQSIALEKMTDRIKKLEQEKEKEMEGIRQEWDQKMQQVSAEVDEKKDLVKQHSEWMVQKTYLENQVQFLKNQLDENKRLHDALLLALQQGMNSQEQESASELMETNKNLSAAMEKMELRCTLLEEKNEKLKMFKKMVKNSSAQQCIHCSKFISNTVFIQHLNNCIEIQNNAENNNNQIQNTQQQQQIQQQQSQNNFLNGVPPVYLNLDGNGLNICINQTMVREDPDNKPYTEYLIQLQYQNVTWTVARKYKNFCELHSVLQNSFQGMKFPDSSSTIINSQTDINSMFYSKRPTVIEERRKALQQYIRDLAQIDLIRNSKPFKNFLEIGKHLDTQSNLTKSQLQQQQQQQQQNEQDQMNGNNNQFNNSQFSNRSEIRNQVMGYFQKQQQEGFIGSAGNLEQQQQEYNNNNNMKIDKKMMPQSPSSFLKSWQEKNKENQHNKQQQQQLEGNNPIMSKKNVQQYMQQFEHENQQQQQQESKQQQIQNALSQRISQNIQNNSMVSDNNQSASSNKFDKLKQIPDNRQSSNLRNMQQQQQYNSELQQNMNAQQQQQYFNMKLQQQQQILKQQFQSKNSSNNNSSHKASFQSIQQGKQSQGVSPNLKDYGYMDGRYK